MVWTVSIAILLLLAAGASLALSSRMHRSTQSRVVGSLDDLPAAARIVILGCRPQLRSGRPNAYLVARVAAAAAAYHHRPGHTILCTGLPDEVAAMRAALDSARVPDSAIALDPGSRRTIESIEFVALRHKDEPILLVTQPFHMPRALSLARWSGLQSWGLLAAGARPGRRAQLRERLAELRALYDRTFG